jgi:GH18 family chitinase
MQQPVKWIFLLLVSLCLLSPVKSQSQKSKPPFRIVGYYSLQAAMTDPLHTVPFNKLTHINLWFLNPDSAGNFKQDLSPLLPFVAAAHKKNVKVLASIGGGSSQPQYHLLSK